MARGKNTEQRILRLIRKKPQIINLAVARVRQIGVDDALGRQGKLIDAGLAPHQQQLVADYSHAVAAGDAQRVAVLVEEVDAVPVYR